MKKINRNRLGIMKPNDHEVTLDGILGDEFEDVTIRVSNARSPKESIDRVIAFLKHVVATLSDG